MRENVLKRKIALKTRRKRRIRANVSGCETCPRISVFKSNRTIYAQAIDDVSSSTICASSGKVLNLKANKEGAVGLAKDLAAKLKEKNVSCAVFDRNGYLYHGVIASFAEALRENGIKL